MNAQNSRRGGVITFAPTYKGGYERLYKYLESNIEWNQPKYGIWNPELSEALVASLFDSGMNFGYLTDQKLDFPITVGFFPSSNKGVYVYSNEDRTSVRSEHRKESPFKYTPIDPAKITKDSKVEIAEVSVDKINFLKNVYLK